MTLARSHQCNIADEEVFVFPASFGQQRLWFLDRLFPNSSGYNVVNVLRLKGLLNITALEASFNEIVRRHEVLRTNFDTVKGNPVQIVSSELKISISLIDLQSFYTKLQKKNRTSVFRYSLKKRLSRATGDSS